MVDQNIGYHFYFQNIFLIFNILFFLNIPQVKSTKDFNFLDLLHP